MQEHKKDAETSKEYTSNETDPNKRTIRLIVSAIKIENTWDKCHQADCDKDQTGDEFIHSSGLYADFLRCLLQYGLWYFPNRQYREIRLAQFARRPLKPLEKLVGKLLRSFYGHGCRYHCRTGPEMPSMLPL